MLDLCDEILCGLGRHGQGDIFLIQEAEGFEDGGAIAARLLSHSMKTAYFQKGKAPPLAVVAKGPLAEDIRYYGDAAEKLSGQRPSPENEISIKILACDTIPWGGAKDFSNHHEPIPHDNLRRHQKEAPPDDEESSSNEDEPVQTPASSVNTEDKTHINYHHSSRCQAPYIWLKTRGQCIFQ